MASILGEAAKSVAEKYGQKGVDDKKERKSVLKHLKEDGKEMLVESQGKYGIIKAASAQKIEKRNSSCNYRVDD